MQEGAAAHGNTALHTGAPVSTASSSCVEACTTALCTQKFWIATETQCTVLILLLYFALLVCNGLCGEIFLSFLGGMVAGMMGTTEAVRST